MARKRAASLSEGTTTKRIKTTDDPTPPLRRSTRIKQAKAIVGTQDALSDASDGEDLPAESARGKTKARTPANVATVPQKATSKGTSVKDEPSKSAKGKMRAHTPAKRIKKTPDDSQKVKNEDPTSMADSDNENVEELPAAPQWPRYKDDLPNAFNGDVDPEKDFISKAPVEIIDSIIWYLQLDHDPDQGVKAKEKSSKPHTHVLMSMAAMSRLFYHATESFARRFLKKNEKTLNPRIGWENEKWYQDSVKAQKERDDRRRRSARLAAVPQPKIVEIYRKELCDRFQWRCAICLKCAYSSCKFSNAVNLCMSCEQDIHGPTMTLTDALKSYDLRDYMLLKSRQPGPRAKFTDLPAITYGSEHKSLGFPVFQWKVVFYFRVKDVEKVAGLVHGDVEKHMQEKNEAKEKRQLKARTKRVREFVIEYHEDRLEITSSKTAKRHQRRLEELRALGPDVQEEGAYTLFGCVENFCYHNIGLCENCGDVRGRQNEDCYVCDSAWVDKRYEQYYAKALGI